MKNNSIKILILFFLIQIIKTQVLLGHCRNGTRTAMLEDSQKMTFQCIDCPEGQYTYFNNKTKTLQCQKCPAGSSNSKDDITINYFLSEDFKQKYSFSTHCSIQSDKCPKWQANYFSMKVQYVDSLSYKTYFTMNQYYMNDGELIVKYINYNGGIDKAFNIYINDKLSFTDDNDNNVLKIKTFEVKKGENIFMFEYLVNGELKSKNKNINDNQSFLEIFEIKFKDAEISALGCDKYGSIEKMSNSILNSCEYDISKCDANNDICTFRFYSELKSEYCIKQSDSYIRDIVYQKLENAKCKELTPPTNRTVPCEHCSYGEYTILSEDTKTCAYCEDNSYNSEEKNDEDKCGSVCDEENNKRTVKSLYYRNIENPNTFSIKKIEIIEPLGSALIIYEKFNESNDAIFFIETDSNTIKRINPNEEDIDVDYYSFSVPLVYGNHSFQIKGSNVNLIRVIFKGSKEGGNYKCLDKIKRSEEMNCGKNNEFYSTLQSKCIKCPLGTVIDKNKKCKIYNQFINNVYTFDNSDINMDLFSNNYELVSENISYYLNINPTNPLIYLKNITSGNNAQYDIDIIGKELKSIKLVKGITERGIILSYISEKNKTHIYIKCNPDITEDNKPQIKLKQAIVNSEKIANYFFMIESNTSCPYCLKSEVKLHDTNDSKCVDGFKKVVVSDTNNSMCVIKPFNNEEILKITDDTNLLLNKKTKDADEQLIIKVFEINEDVPIKYEKTKDEIISSYEFGEKCGGKANRLFIVLIILGCFVALVAIGLGGVLIWKMVDNKKKAKKIQNTKERMSELSVISVDEQL